MCSLPLPVWDKFRDLFLLCERKRSQFQLKMIDWICCRDSSVSEDQSRPEDPQTKGELRPPGSQIHRATEAQRWTGIWTFLSSLNVQIDWGVFFYPSDVHLTPAIMDGDTLSNTPPVCSVLQYNSDLISHSTLNLFLHVFQVIENQKLQALLKKHGINFQPSPEETQYWFLTSSWINIALIS